MDHEKCFNKRIFPDKPLTRIAYACKSFFLVADVAQLAEHLVVAQGVGSSNLLIRPRYFKGLPNGKPFFLCNTSMNRSFAIRTHCATKAPIALARMLPPEKHPPHHRQNQRAFIKTHSKSRRKIHSDSNRNHRNLAEV